MNDNEKISKPHTSLPTQEDPAVRCLVLLVHVLVAWIVRVLVCWVLLMCVLVAMWLVGTHRRQSKAFGIKNVFSALPFRRHIIQVSSGC